MTGRFTCSWLLPTYLALAWSVAFPVVAQPLDFTRGGPVEVTSTNGIEWRQGEQVVVARGNARAVRDGVTLEADRLIARYRSRSDANKSVQPTSGQIDPNTPLSGGEIWRIEAEGRVHINTQTDRAQGDRAVYDMDQSVMVLTGRDLKLTTPENSIAARDGLEYWVQRRMAVARGAASVTTSDNRHLTGDTLVAYFLQEGGTPASGVGRPGMQGSEGTSTQHQVPGEGSKLEKIEIFGNVEIRTPDEVVRGDRGVYSPVTGIARLLGNVRITRGENQLNGAEAVVNLRTNTARLVAAPGSRVQGLMLPQSSQNSEPRRAGQPIPRAGRSQ